MCVQSCSETMNVGVGAGGGSRSNAWCREASAPVMSQGTRKIAWFLKFPVEHKSQHSLLSLSQPGHLGRSPQAISELW